MSTLKSKLSQQSTDKIVKLNYDLKKKLIKQLNTFNPTDHKYLLDQLEELMKSGNKRDKKSNIYSEITIFQLKEIVNCLCQLDFYYILNYKDKELEIKLGNLTKKCIRDLIILNSNFNDDTNESNYDNLINDSINKSSNNDNLIHNIFSYVFKYLSINDLFNFRLVNKQFKQLIDNANFINKLIIGQPDIDYNWCYNNTEIEDKDIISLKCFKKIKSLLIFNLDKNLKYIKIYDDKFELEELSSLINLDAIELNYYFKFDHNERIINLNNLKFLVLNNQIFKLNTPKLVKIQFLNMNYIKSINNAESIKHLITQEYEDQLKIFKNLEIMELRYLENETINDDLLNIFKNLKQLNINLDFSELSYSNDKIKNSLIIILNDKIKLKREIDIYLEGIKIENIDKFYDLITNKSHWKFKMNNYNLLDLNLPFIKFLDYCKLEECVHNIKDRLPLSFFDKFFNINFVYINRTKCIDILNWFLNNLKYLTVLYIDLVLLGQNFYNNLPVTIDHLIIANNSDINYNFILKLPKLNYFTTFVDKDLFNLAFTSFLYLKYLNYFQFYFEKKEIKIEKDCEFYYLNEDETKLNFNQLIEEYNKMISK